VKREIHRETVKYSEWCDSVPLEIRGDSLWKMEVYRLSLFASHLGWRDVTKLFEDGRTVALANQLYRALGSIHANISEGYSRGTGRDRARFYEYALGSARESRGWYYSGSSVLSELVCVHRLQLLTQIIRLLLQMIPDQPWQHSQGRTVTLSNGTENFRRRTNEALAN
jgi:four helix bundle protein